MKYGLFIKLILFLLVLACTGPFLLKDKTGMPLMSIEKIKWPQFTLPDFSLFSTSSTNSDAKKSDDQPIETEILSPSITVPEVGQEVVKIYKFKDENDVIHYTNKIPDHGNYTTIYMPVVKTKKNAFIQIKEKIDHFTKKLAPKDTAPSTPASNSKPEISLPDIYTNPTKAIEDALELKKQVEKNFQEQEDTFRSLNR